MYMFYITALIPYICKVSCIARAVMMPYRLLHQKQIKHLLVEKKTRHHDGPSREMQQSKHARAFMQSGSCCVQLYMCYKCLLSQQQKRKMKKQRKRNS